MTRWVLYGFTVAAALGWMVFGWFSGDAGIAWSKSAVDAWSGSFFIACKTFALFLVSVLPTELLLKLRKDAPATYGRLNRGLVTAAVPLALLLIIRLFHQRSLVIWLPIAFLGVMVGCAALCLMAYPALTQAGVSRRIVRGALVVTAAWGLATLFLFIVFMVRLQSPEFLVPPWPWQRAAGWVAIVMSALSLLGFLMVSVGMLGLRIASFLKKLAREFPS